MNSLIKYFWAFGVFLSFSLWGEETSFIEKITVEGYIPSIPAGLETWGVMIQEDKKIIQELIASYPSPQKFSRELRRILNSKDYETRTLALDFVTFHLKILPLSQPDFELLGKLALKDRHSKHRFSALYCLRELHQKEFLKIFRESLEDDDPYIIALALETMGDMKEFLTHEDIGKIASFLEDGRQYSFHVPGTPLDTAESSTLSLCAMKTLGRIGEKAAETYQKIFTIYIPEKIYKEYDESKFRQFLKEIENPNLSISEFWELVEQTKMTPHLIVPWNLFYEPEMQSSPIENIFQKENNHNIQGVTIEYVQWKCSEKPYITQVLYQLKPKDLRTLFLLIQSYLCDVHLASQEISSPLPLTTSYSCEISEKKQKDESSLRVLRNYSFLTQIPSLKPLITFFQKHPEILW